MKKLNINLRNENGNRHGYWEKYWFGDNLYFKGFFNNGEQVGYEEHDWIGDELPYKTFYI